MRDTMYAGGPDDAGEYIDRDIALGHRRLSIIDLSAAGHQPMESACQRYVITYNGEVYNFRALSKELQREGARFRGHSDTEVILHAFLHWGAECVNRFRGMFAFAVYDRYERELHLFRDRIGVKPLHYLYGPDFFAFASELKAFHRFPRFDKRISPAGAALFFRDGYIAAPYTIFEACRKVEPGVYMRVGLEPHVTIEEKRYWRAPDSVYQAANGGRWGDLKDAVEAKLRESFGLRMVADVPVGMFLSGGVDSTLLLALLAEEGGTINTFTIGSDRSEYDEASAAREVASYFGTKHREWYVDRSDVVEVIPELSKTWDEPFADLSQVPTYLVAKFASQHVSVALSADGGDEQYFGYPKYWRALSRSERLRRIRPFLRLLALMGDDALLSLGRRLGLMDKLVKLKRLAEHGRVDTLSIYVIGEEIFTSGELERLVNGLAAVPELRVRERLAGRGAIPEAMAELDMETFLPDQLLCKVDRASMAHGLEARDPFLDHELVELSRRVPLEEKYRHGTQGKLLLREILASRLPSELFDRPKKGFSIPIEAWGREDSFLHAYFADVADYLRRMCSGVVEPGPLVAEMDKYLAGRPANFRRVWFGAVFGAWHRTWMAEAA